MGAGACNEFVKDPDAPDGYEWTFTWLYRTKEVLQKLGYIKHGLRLFISFMRRAFRLLTSWIACVFIRARLPIQRLSLAAPGPTIAYT